MRAIIALSAAAAMLMALAYVVSGWTYDQGSQSGSPIADFFELARNTTTPVPHQGRQLGEPIADRMESLEAKIQD